MSSRHGEMTTSTGAAARRPANFAANVCGELGGVGATPRISTSRGSNRAYMGDGKRSNETRSGAISTLCGGSLPFTRQDRGLAESSTATATPPGSTARASKSALVTVTVTVPIFCPAWLTSISVSPTMRPTMRLSAVMSTMSGFELLSANGSALGEM